MRWPKEISAEERKARLKTAREFDKHIRALSADDQASIDSLFLAPELSKEEKQVAIKKAEEQRRYAIEKKIRNYYYSNKGNEIELIKEIINSALFSTSKKAGLINLIRDGMISNLYKIKIFEAAEESILFSDDERDDMLFNLDALDSEEYQKGLRGEGLTLPEVIKLLEGHDA